MSTITEIARRTNTKEADWEYTADSWPHEKGQLTLGLINKQSMLYVVAKVDISTFRLIEFEYRSLLTSKHK